MTRIKPFDIAVMYVIALLASSISSYSAYGQDVPKSDVAKYVVKSREPLDVVVVTSADGLLVREVVNRPGSSTVELYRERVGVRNERGEVSWHVSQYNPNALTYTEKITTVYVNKKTGKTIRTKERRVEHRHTPAGITSRRLP